MNIAEIVWGVLGVLAAAPLLDLLPDKEHQIPSMVAV